MQEKNAQAQTLKVSKTSEINITEKYTSIDKDRDVSWKEMHSERKRK